MEERSRPSNENCHREQPLRAIVAAFDPHAWRTWLECGTTRRWRPDHHAVYACPHLNAREPLGYIANWAVAASQPFPAHGATDATLCARTVLPLHRHETQLFQEKSAPISPSSSNR